jgi:hypothetical protein
VRNTHEATVVNDRCAPRYRKGQTLYLVPNSRSPEVGREYLFIYRAAPPHVAGDAGTPIIGTICRATADEWIVSRWQGDDRKTSLPKKLWYPTYAILGVYLRPLTPKDEFFADPYPRPKWASCKIPLQHYQALSDDMASRWERGDLMLVKHEPPKEAGQHVLIEMQSGDLMVRYLEKMTAKTLTVTRYNPAQTTSIKRADVKSMHRVIDTEEALFSMP